MTTLSHSPKPRPTGSSPRPGRGAGGAVRRHQSLAGGRRPPALADLGHGGVAEGLSPARRLPGSPRPTRVRARTWFSSYVQTYLERDVRSIAAIRDLASFRRFLGLVATQPRADRQPDRPRGAARRLGRRPSPPGSTSSRSPARSFSFRPTSRISASASSRARSSSSPTRAWRASSSASKPRSSSTLAVPGARLRGVRGVGDRQEPAQRGEAESSTTSATSRASRSTSSFRRGKETSPSSRPRTPAP